VLSISGCQKIENNQSVQENIQKAQTELALIKQKAKQVAYKIKLDDKYNKYKNALENMVNLDRNSGNHTQNSKNTQDSETQLAIKELHKKIDMFVVDVKKNYGTLLAKCVKQKLYNKKMDPTTKLICSAAFKAAGEAVQEKSQTANKG